ncbi:MgtC/SapB family protein [Clostridiisalibacter paucivorans]|uniref:MgtC/SapB family protein n=1 Tax=Clostridiisalibacter paucivorans TaxID=408753 RepID=UPI0004789B46|nr:MgtC/SapB family protein [Clostridiisalibacter paucivorans]
MISTKQIVFRIVLSIVLSGLIGMERESVKRPAGFRTHILVCVGSTLVMLVGLYIFDTYKYQTNIDPGRLAAQVISGIGFLGAGTIIKEGDSVKGLTTAASLWAVACVGLAIGSGFYTGSILSVIIILITLIIFTKVETKIKSRRKFMKLRIVSENKPGQIGKIGLVTGELGIVIDRIELEKNSEDILIISMLVKLKDDNQGQNLLSEISKQEGVLEVSNR